MLHELLRVKEIREDSARRQVQKCEHHLRQCEEELKQKESELSEYIDWRCQEEKRLYDNIINTEVHQNDLDRLKLKVAQMREKDIELEQAVRTAEKTVSDAQHQLNDARNTHAETMQALEKFREFTSVMDKEAAKEAARLEDLEMEEFTARAKGD